MPPGCPEQWEETWVNRVGLMPLEAQRQPRRYTLPTKSYSSRGKVLWVRARALRIRGGSSHF